MIDVIGHSESEAKKVLQANGVLRIETAYLTNDLQIRADTMLVVRCKINGDSAQLVLTPFILNMQESAKNG